MKDNCIVLHFTAPQADKISPVLRASLGPERACHIYIEMAKDVFQSLGKLKDVSIFPVYEKTSKYPDLLWLDSEDPGFMEMQKSADKWQRTLNAVQWAFNAGAKRVVFLSVESPGVPREWIENAFRLLADDKSVVIGPAQDGNFYLFGLAAYIPQIFEGYPWEGRRICDEISDRVKKMRMTVHSLPEFYAVKDDQTLHQWTEMKDKARYQSIQEKPNAANGPK